jgi:Ala-tRNA(Pro) deacylase
LVCLRGTKRLNLKQLKEHTKTNDLHFASAEELFSELKVLPGSVSLFAMIYAKNTKLILDKELWESDLVGFHPNENTSTLVISHEMLVKFCSLLKIKPEIIDLKE